MIFFLSGLSGLNYFNITPIFNVLSSAHWAIKDHQEAKSPQSVCIYRTPKVLSYTYLAVSSSSFYDLTYQIWYIFPRIFQRFYQINRNFLNFWATKMLFISKLGSFLPKIDWFALFSCQSRHFEARAGTFKIKLKVLIFWLFALCWSNVQCEAD